MGSSFLVYIHDLPTYIVVCPNSVHPVLDILRLTQIIKKWSSSCKNTPTNIQVVIDVLHETIGMLIPLMDETFSVVPVML